MFWQYVYERDIDRLYLGSMFTESNGDSLIRIFLERPSRVDYLVRRWSKATDLHKERLYFAILYGFPLLDCLQWGLENDGFQYEDGVDEDLSDFRFPYLDSNGRAKFRTLTEYEAWLSRQRTAEGEFFENPCSARDVFDTLDQSVISELSSSKYMHKLK